MNLRKNQHNGSSRNRISSWDFNFYNYNNWDGNKNILGFNKKGKKWQIETEME